MCVPRVLVCLSTQVKGPPLRAAPSHPHPCIPTSRAYVCVHPMCVWELATVRPLWCTDVAVAHTELLEQSSVPTAIPARAEARPHHSAHTCVHAPAVAACSPCGVPSYWLQVSDWPYHKRICTPPKKEEAAKPSSGPSTAPAAAAPSTATPAATPAASTAASTSSAAASAGSSADMDESYDEEDKAALQSVSKGCVPDLGLTVHWP